MNYVWEVRVPPGPGTMCDGSLLVLGPGVAHRRDPRTTLINTGPSWSWDHEWRFTLGPRTRSDPSPVILWPGGHPPFWCDMYIHIYICPMKNESESIFIIYSLFNIRCCVFSYIIRLLYCRIWTTSETYGCLLVLGPGVTGHSWSTDQEWLDKLDPKARRYPAFGIMYIFRKRWNWDYIFMSRILLH